MFSRKSLTPAFAFLLLAGLGGCKVGPDYVGPPPAPIAPAYTQINPEEGVAQVQSTDLALWWHRFGDSRLDHLVVRAVAGNPPLREAALRIYESRARYGTVRSGFFPQVDMDGSYYYQKISRSTGGTVTGGGGIVDTTRELWSWGMNLGWEIDVFGRLRRQLEAADADIGADVELYRDTLIILLSDVARNYVDARAYQERIRIVLQNIDAQNQTLAIAQRKFEVQVVSELDVAQARANLESSKSELPTLELRYRESINRLSVLLGCPPGEVDAMMAEPVPIPLSPENIMVGIPAELLRRRPDIREAERRVAAQTARIGVAVGDIYPQFSIIGTFGLDAADFSRLFNSDSINAGVGPAFRWNILNFGRFRCNIAAQEFLQQQWVAAYQQTVLEAAEEVDNALAGFVREKQRRTYLANTVAAYRRSVELSQMQYAEGAIDFQRVLDSQRNLLNFQNQLVQAEANVVNNVILLYRALGGGWETPINAEPFQGGPAPAEPAPEEEPEPIPAPAPEPAPAAVPVPAP